MEEIKKQLDEFTKKLDEFRKQRNHNYDEQYRIEKENEKLDSNIHSYEELVEKYKKMLSSELLGDVIGKYFINHSYDSDKKSGNITIGKIVSFSRGSYVNYIGFKLYYNGSEYNHTNWVDSDIYIKSIEYNTEKNPYPHIISLEPFTYTDGTYKFISEDEYKQNLAAIEALINRSNALCFC